MAEGKVRQSVPGFVPWEQGGGGKFRPGDRVRVERLCGRGRNRYPAHDPRRYAGEGVVVDAYDRASDAFSPYYSAVRVRRYDTDDPPEGIEFFLDYALVERIEG